MPKRFTLTKADLVSSPLMEQCRVLRHDRFFGCLNGSRSLAHYLSLIAATLVVAAPRAPGAEPPIRYVLDLSAPQTHRVSVTMTVPDAPPNTEFQFPAWNALYQIRDFIENVEDLRADCDGRPVSLTSPASKTSSNARAAEGWSTEYDLNTRFAGPEPCAALTLNYEVYANRAGPFGAILDGDYAFLNPAMLLFYMPKDRSRAVVAKYILPAGWKLATLLDQEKGANEFAAQNYDVLADSPAEAGHFQEYSYTQGSATYRVVVHADPSDYEADRLLNSLEKITATETALMRDVPFSRYTFFLEFPRAGGGGGMEHADGTAISIPASVLRDHWDALESTAAHEFFHAWNVKRIRPQGLEPIDYIHGDDTSDLWFSEGVTSTYALLTLLRSGLISRETFYDRLAGAIQSLQRRPARLTQSAEESGREAWLEKYPTYFRPERSISYYNKGELLGFLLDLAIRHATRGQNSLDTVMRALDDNFARRGRFFTDDDLRKTIAALAPGFTALDEFFKDDVTGTAELDYKTYLGYVGLDLITSSVERPALGFSAVRSFDGPIVVESIEPGSSAEKAGILQGDVLVEMDHRPLEAPPESLLENFRPGQKVEFQVRRAGQLMKVKFALGFLTETEYSVVEAPNASAEEIALRRGWVEEETEGGAQRISYHKDATGRQ